MIKLFQFLSTLALVVALTACGATAQTKRYTMTGTIRDIDMANKSALIDHDKIADWMDAMVMDYPIKPDAELAKIKAGDRMAPPW